MDRGAAEGAASCVWPLWSLRAGAAAGCHCRVLLPEIYGSVRWVPVPLLDVYGSVWSVGAGAAGGRGPQIVSAIVKIKAFAFTPEE